MSILSSELKEYKAAVMDDSAASGGRLTANELVDGVKNNLWPDADSAERTAGSTKYRKTFKKIDNAGNLALQNSVLFVETQSPGDDAVTIFPATQRNTKADITGSERQYGAGQLNADVSAGAGSVDVLVEDPADPIFADGDLIRISDKADVEAGTGNEEYIRLASPAGLSFAGSVATLTFAAGVTLQNAYTAASTRVAACIEAGDIQTSADNWAETSAAGTYDEATYPPELDNESTVEETFTLSFTGATTFDVIGDTLGNLGSFSTGADCAPNNADFGKPYFTLRSAGWGGTWANGDTVVFQTHPAAYPIWNKRVIPAGAANMSGNNNIVAVRGESA